LSFANESVLLLGAYEADQVNEWLGHLQKAKLFYDWFVKVKMTFKKCEKQKDLPQQTLFKLQQIVEFCENFGQVENKTIAMVS